MGPGSDLNTNWLYSIIRIIHLTPVGWLVKGITKIMREEGRALNIKIV